LPADVTAGKDVTAAGGATAEARPGVSWPHAAALALIAALAGLSYGWGISRDPLEIYYAAAVRSMSMSWHNFVFGAFDPAGTVTLDKLPGAFWLQALAVRAFGYHTWAMVAPQVVEGVLTVLVLYAAVRRLAGSTAGLIAAAVVAISPATVALNRGNISDSLMILLLVLAADAVSRALARGSQGWLVLAAVWTGLAFQAKMIEAWLVLPAFGLTYLLAAPGKLSRRVRHLLLAGVVAGLVSLSWMTAVSLVPAGHRPYVDGSRDNSSYQQVFVYNGFGRFGDHTPLQLLAGQSLGLGSVLKSPPPGPARLLHGSLGRDAGWLLPAALVVAGWGIASRRRQPRGDPLRSCFVLWGGWLLTLAVTFSLTSTINAYYTAALTPAVAAILGAGAAAAWPRRSEAGVRLGLAVLLVLTVGYAAWLLTGGSAVPSWLLPAVVTAGLVALGVALGSLAAGGDTLFAAAGGAALIAAVLAPAASAAIGVARGQGAFDTPFEPASQRDAIDDVFVRTPARVALTIPRLVALNGTPYLLAAQTAALASVFIYDSGREALPIGGFTGTIPAPTLRQLQADIRAQRFRLVLATSSGDPRLRWIARHCQAVSPPGSLHSYLCLPPGAHASAPAGAAHASVPARAGGGS
jgi:4-amino-4-deoxy-L-arabinose transferase-like glycosyltransferase